MQNTIKIGVVSALVLFAILEMVSISIARTQIQLKIVYPEGLIDATQKGAVIIDIRREEEWNDTGIIDGAELITAFQKDGSIHPEFHNKFFSAVDSKETPIILYCRTGNRTNAIGNALIRELGFTNVSHLSDGINGWLRENRKITHID